LTNKTHSTNDFYTDTLVQFVYPTVKGEHSVARVASLKWHILRIHADLPNNK